MAQIIWTLAAVEDLDRIAAYMFDPEAAADLVKRAFKHVSQLEKHPLSGPRIPELRRSGLPYRQIIEPPLRLFYKYQNEKVYIVHVIRGERLFSRRRLIARDKSR
jgi:toxin ParE1/3/4